MIENYERAESSRKLRMNQFKCDGCDCQAGPITVPKRKAASSWVGPFKCYLGSGNFVPAEGDDNS